MMRKWIFLILLLSLFLSACTGQIFNYSSCVPFNHNAKIAVIPFANNTETPMAGERAMSVTAAVMETYGLRNLVVYQNHNHGKVLFPGMNKIVSEPKLLDWARSTHAQYAMTGSVNEWTYKVGLDGEPVVGLSLQLIDLKSGRIVWTAVGSLSGGSRIAVTTTAQRLINSLLRGLFCSKSVYAK